MEISCAAFMMKRWRADMKLRYRDPSLYDKVSSSLHAMIVVWDTAKRGPVPITVMPPIPDELTRVLGIIDQDAIAVGTEILTLHDGKWRGAIVVD
jgi:hypothetical protein